MRSIALSIVLLLFIVAPRIVLAQEAPPKGATFICGLNATYIFLNKSGHHVPYSDLLGEFARQSPPDSLLAIKNVLGKHGCKTVGIKADADYFLENKVPAIVFLQLSGFGPSSENHFAYLACANRQDGVELLDPIFDAIEPSLMNWDTFVRAYQGVALISNE